ncbi:MAG TPA: hypothetical protein VFU37_08180, partial [Pyrinomonadaceae bacterium]|nr:hypothetical protein [Pyrinomonadaceae bacterium]
MPILLKRIRRLAFFAVLFAAWFNAAAARPVEAVSAVEKMVLRNSNLWERHRELAIGTVAIVGLQSLLIVGLIVQRSRRKRAERSLRDSEERMSLAAEAANLGMWVWDVKRNEFWMTDKGRALFGFAPDTRLDHELLTTRIHPEDRAA